MTTRLRPKRVAACSTAYSAAAPTRKWKLVAMDSSAAEKRPLLARYCTYTDRL